MISVAVILDKFYRTLEFVKPPAVNVCINTNGDHKSLGILFVLILSNVAGAMLGMLFILYRKYKAYRSSLIKTFYRDGIGYFVLLSALALTNSIINFAPGVPLVFKFVLSQPETLFHAILSTRMLLHLRSIARGDSDKVPGASDDTWGAAYNTVGREHEVGDEGSEISTMHFA